jgi:undecaprenyl-diphosphatase
LFIDKWFANTQTNDEVTYPKALKIGLFQVIAMIPGVSRSAATIIGGLQQKLSRKAAAEFSFFLAVPTMFAATAYKLFKYVKQGGSFGSEEITLLAIGNIVAFVVAMIAIKAFISYLTKYGFKIFGWYRIIVGAIIVILYTMGYNLEVF